jgi:Uma2 family endonuclease
MSTAHRFIPNYSVTDYQHWQGDWELIDGVAIAMTPSPFAPHERVVAKLVGLFVSAVETQPCDCAVYAGLDWIVDSHTVVRPDVMIVCGQQPARYLECAPSLIVEVLSASTELQDQTTKRAIYQKHGVAFYLLVDPDAMTMECLELVDQSYQPRVVTASESIILPSGCQIPCPPWLTA